MEQRPQLHGSLYGGNHRRHIAALAGVIDHAEDQDRHDRTDGAERYQTEAVVRGMAVVTDGGDAHAERHNEGHRHWAGGHTAGIKCHA